MRREARDSTNNEIKRRNEDQGTTEKELNEILFPVGRDLEDIQKGLHEQNSGPGEIVERLNRLSSMVEQLAQKDRSQSATESQVDINDWDLPGESASKPLAPHSRLEDEYIPSLRRSSQHTNNSSGEDFPLPTGHGTDFLGSVGTLNLGHLSLEDGGKSRYG